jgi:hypothetical protein
MRTMQFATALILITALPSITLKANPNSEEMSQIRQGIDNARNDYHKYGLVEVKRRVKAYFSVAMFAQSRGLDSKSAYIQLVAAYTYGKMFADATNSKTQGVEEFFETSRYEGTMTTLVSNGVFSATELERIIKKSQILTNKQ